jgi:hypothetical protein
LYQRKERETPFPLYVGVKLHAHDRQKDIINIFHGFGISVSYDRVMSLRKTFAQAVSKQWADDGVVVPTNTRRGVFVTGAVDNIDESGRYEFHGTAMTLTCHATEDNFGFDPPTLSLDIPDDAAVKLPDDYAMVPYADEYTGDIKLTSIREGTGRPNLNVIPVSNTENNWLKHVHEVYTEKEGIVQDVPVTFSGFFSHKQSIAEVRPRATVGVFPILPDKAASLATQKHAMVTIMKATEFVNPGQVPVIVGDCPLYAQQKKCQLLYPDEVGESKIVSMMGFLHIEMASQECGGKLLSGSGWDRIFTHGNVYTPGTAKSLLGSSNVKRTRHAYQLTLAFLYQMEKEAYEEYCNEGYGPHEPIQIWEERLSAFAPLDNHQELSAYQLPLHKRTVTWRLAFDAKCN